MMDTKEEPISWPLIEYFQCPIVSVLLYLSEHEAQANLLKHKFIGKEIQLNREKVQLVDRRVYTCITGELTYKIICVWD